MARKKKDIEDDQVAKARATMTGDLGTLVEKYIVARDKKEAIMQAAKDKCLKIDAALERIEGIILASFEELGMDSASTAAGTAYKSTQTSATVADWDEAFGYIQTHEAWHLLERRVNKKAVVAIKEETGELVPGVNWREEVVINIRRKS